MADQRVTRILCAADPRGSAEDVERLMALAGDRQADAVAIVGDLGGDGPEGFRALFRALGAGGLPTYCVPGPSDAPVGAYLREAHNVEVVFPFLHGVHGTAAYAPDGHVVFAGLGGEIRDSPDEPREEIERLRYPRWEAEYRLKLLQELDEQQLVLLFWTPPEHKGEGTPGSDVLAELTATYRARLVVCHGPPGVQTLGRSLIVRPGSLKDGHCAVADLHTREVELEQLTPTRS